MGRTKSVSVAALVVAGLLSGCQAFSSKPPTRPLPALTSTASPTSEVPGRVTADVAVPTDADFDDTDSSDSDVADKVSDLTAPLVDSSQVYVAAAGKLTAYPLRDPAQAWHWPAPTDAHPDDGAFRVRTTTRPTLVEGGVLVAAGRSGGSDTAGTDADGREPEVVLVNTAGQRVWDVPSSAPVAVSGTRQEFFTVDAGRGGAPQLTARSTASGKTLWSVPYAGGDVLPGPTSSGSMVVVNRAVGRAQVLDAATGKTTRTWSAGRRNLSVPQAAEEPADVTGAAGVTDASQLVLAPGPRGTVIGLNLLDGKRKFTATQLGAASTWRFGPGGVVTTVGGLGMVDPDRGRQRWKVAGAAGTFVAVTGAGSAIFSRGSGELVAVNAADGSKQRWQASADRGLKPVNAASFDVAGSVLAMFACGSTAQTCTDPRVVQVDVDAQP